jgi:hypothetical protein
VRAPPERISPEDRRAFVLEKRADRSSFLLLSIVNANFNCMVLQENPAWKTFLS